jgi:hypothetical protein
MYSTSGEVGLAALEQLFNVRLHIAAVETLEPIDRGLAVLLASRLLPRIPAERTLSLLGFHEQLGERVASLSLRGGVGILLEHLRMKASFSGLGWRSCVHTSPMLST